MAALILSLDGEILQEVELAKPRTVIGRRPYNDVSIDNLAVSGEHAAVVQIGNDLFVEDLGSTNGTVVNGKPAEKHLLKDGDLIEIGKFHLKFVAGKVKPQTDFEKTMLIRSPFAGKSLDSTPATPLDAPTRPMGNEPFPSTFSPAMETAPAPKEAPATEMHAHIASLRVLTGKQAGTEIQISKPLTSIGKKGAQVAVITRRPSGYFLNHVQGDRAPNVNSKSIGDKPYALANRDLIEIAGVRMEFMIK